MDLFFGPSVSALIGRTPRGHDEDRNLNRRPDGNRYSRTNNSPSTSRIESFIRSISIVPPGGKRIPNGAEVVMVSLDTQSPLNWISYKVVERMQLNDLVERNVSAPDVRDFNQAQVKARGVIRLQWSWYPDGHSVYGPVELQVSERGEMDMIFGKRYIVSENLLSSNMDTMAPLTVHERVTISESARQSLYREEQLQAQARLPEYTQNYSLQYTPSLNRFSPRDASYTQGAAYSQPTASGYKPPMPQNSYDQQQSYIGPYSQSVSANGYPRHRR